MSDPLYNDRVRRDTTQMLMQMHKRKTLTLNEIEPTPWRSRHERVPACEKGWDRKEWRAAMWILLGVIIGGALLSAIAPPDWMMR